MELENCLAVTGGPTSGPFFIIAAVLMLAGLGVFALRRGRKSCVGRTLGVLALIGAIAFVPLAAPGVAQAAEQNCPPSKSSQTEPPKPEITYVTPAAPTLAPLCGVRPVITMPDDPYFTYTLIEDEETATVTATLKLGLKNVQVTANAQTVWTFDTSFDPVTTPPSDLSFIYMMEGWDGDWGILYDAETAAYVESQGAELELQLIYKWTATYGVFDSFGNQLTEFGEAEFEQVEVRDHSVVQSGVNLDFTLVNLSITGGLPLAQAHFEELGPLPEGATVAIIPNRVSSQSYEGTLSTSVVNECGEIIGISGTGNAFG